MSPPEGEMPQAERAVCSLPRRRGRAGERAYAPFFRESVPFSAILRHLLVEQAAGLALGEGRFFRQV